MNFPGSVLLRSEHGCQVPERAHCRRFSGIVLTALLATAWAHISSARVSADEPTKDAAREEGSQNDAILSGRITDETGAPVTDAEITLRGPANKKTSTDAAGNYSFAEIGSPGEYRIQIESMGWVNQRNWSKLERVDLTKASREIRNFTLNRAGVVRIQAVDEDGVPLKDIRINVASMADERFRNTESVTTGVDGWATVGGIDPSPVKYIFGLRHDDYAFEKLITFVKEPGVSDPYKITMRKGVSITGTAVCSDKKPPTGWNILAMPTWWHFGVYPNGTPVLKDGVFELKHIVPGEYKVTIDVPNGDSGAQPHTVLTADLLKQKQPLAVKMDYPSPASLTYISGTVSYSGAAEGLNGVWIFARSDDGKYHTSVHINRKQKEFRLGPTPKGLYRLEISAPKIESIKLAAVEAPTEDLKIQLKAREKPRLAGRVLLPDGKTPATRFRLSVLKIRSFPGSNYVQDARWKTINSTDGTFSQEVNSPGIYRISVLADGFAATNSDDIDTQEKTNGIDIVLETGVPLSGTVVDDKGNPLANVKIQSLLLSGKDADGPTGDYVSDVGSVLSDKQGRFTFPHFARGQDELKASLPGYCFTKVEDFNVDNHVGEPLKITMNRGGTIRGLVFDGDGNPAPGKVLIFQDRHYGSDYERGRLAATTSDSKGFYKVDNLPLQNVHIVCGDEWNGLGVVRKTVFSQNGKRLTVNFGGPSPLNGTITVNGEPLAEKRLELAGHSPRSGVLKMFAKTDAGGNFTLFGAPPGIWTLYYQEDQHNWNPLQQVEIGADGSADLGQIDYRVRSITLNCKPSDPQTLSELYFQLMEYNPIWAHGRNVGSLRPRKTGKGPFVFDNVPPGDFEISCRRTGHVMIRQRLTIPADRTDQEIDFEIPNGTASVVGHVAASIIEPGDALKFWSEDGRWQAFASIEKDGSFTLKNMPAGKWLIRDKDTRTWPPIFSITLAEGEQRTLELTDENVSRKESRNGFGTIRTYLPNGALTPCRVSLSGPDGPVPPHSTQFASSSFVAPPGEYRVTVKLKGFETHQQMITLYETKPNGRAHPNWETRIVLKRP